MAKKEVIGTVKLQISAGKANPAPPVGSALGPKGINAQTQDKMGYIIPVEITIYSDRSFTFVLKTPPASDLLKKAAKVEKGAHNSKKEVAGTVTKAQLKEIAELKMPDLNASNVEKAMNIIAGSARSMGIKVQD